MMYTIANYCDYERTIATFQSRGTVFMTFRATPKFGLHRILRTDQRRKSRTPCTACLMRRPSAPLFCDVFRFIILDINFKI